MDREAVIDTLDRYVREAALPLVAVYLYGSFARNEARADSDVDVAVLLPAGTAATLTGPLSVLRGDLERRLRREVDVIDLRRAPVDVRQRVLREGVLLLDRDPAERIRFEVHTRNEYFDLLPYLEQYRKMRVG